jgi:signal transduction histidine kinase
MPTPLKEAPDPAQAVDTEGLGRERDGATVEIVERDRLMIAGALHNTACQSISGLQLLVATLLKRLPDSPQDLREAIGEMGALLRQVSSELRGVVQWLRPAPMREEGLIVSLIELAEEISRAVPCEFRCEDRRMQVDPDIAAHLYQIAYAAALAAAQSRAASCIEISLEADRENGLILSISDDAIPAPEIRPGYESGLCNWELLHLRSRAIGGKLTIHSPKTGGTRVTCHVESA